MTSITNTFDLFSSHVPTLEKYLLSKDKQNFLSSITNSLDRKLFELLINPLPENYTEVFKELRISQRVQQELKSVKLITAIREQTDLQKKSVLVSQFVKQFYSNLNFNYSKPAQTVKYNQDQKIESSQESQQVSTLKLAGSLSAFIQEQVDKDSRNFRSVSEFGLKQLSQQYLLNLSLDNKNYLIEHVQWLITLNDNFVVKFLIGLAEQLAAVKKTQFYQEISSHVFAKLSKQQINLMKTTNQNIMKNNNFVRVWFRVNYEPKIHQKKVSDRKKKPTLQQMDARRKQIYSIYQQVVALQVPFLKAYSNQLLVQTLVLDLKRSDPSKQLFFCYLSTIQSISSYFSSAHRQLLQKQYNRYESSSTPLGSHLNLLSQDYSVDKIINQYLQKLFQKYQDTKQLKQQLNQYLDFNIVNKTHAKVRLAQAQEVQNLHQILTKAEIQQAKKSKEITILEQKTQSFFKAQDDVVLSLRLKNISQIKLKIYEMDLQQYYLQDINRQLDQKINLLYIHPTIQQTIQISGLKTPFHTITKQILLQKIPKTHGLYIVQLESSGITSRAVIRKGSIVCFQQNHIDGRMLKFYDEEGNTINKIGLWVKGRFQQVQNGQFLMPFGKQSQYFTIIAVKDKYAEKITVSLNTQDYMFNVGLIYNHQSFIVGQKTKIILHPTLHLGNQKISLSNLENIKVSAKLTNNLGIKSSLKHQNVKFIDNSDYILQIPLKQYTSQICISIQSEVKNIEGTTIPLNYSKNISINLLESSMGVIDLYLKRTNSGKQNVIQLRGINGELYSNVQVSFKLNIFGFSQAKEIKLKTNKNGQVNLGSLEYVSLVEATFFNSTYQAVNRNWILEYQIQSTPYLNQNQLYYHESDEITLPIPFNWSLTQQNLSQYVTFFGLSADEFEFVQNKLNLIQVKQIDGMTYLVITNIKAGRYQLRFSKIYYQMLINVFKGKKWKTGEIFNQEDGTVMRLALNPYAFVLMGQLKEQPGQTQETLKLTIPISGPSKYIQSIEGQQLRVHVLLKNYHDSIDPQILSSLDIPSLNIINQPQVNHLSFNKSSFYNNKCLSDEQSYVLNRQNQKQFIGNNLEKPRIFLKRIQVRDTKQTDQNLNKQGQYDDMDRCGGGGGGPEGMMRNCAMRQHMADMKQIVYQQYGLNSHNNYLQLSGHTILNAKYQKQLELTVPKGYSQVIVYLISNQSAVKKTFYLQDIKKSQKKDLRHQGLVESDQKSGWSISRQVYPLLKGQKKQVSRSSTWCTVSLSNILQFALIKGHKIPSYISEWVSSPLQKKLSLYDKQSCHELNVFIKYQDAQFFNKYVQPFIRNKINRTFVDMVLIDDKECLKFAKAHMIGKLNQFQKVLLIQAMVDNQMNKQAQQIAISMELFQKSTKRSFQAYKGLFDIVLNSEADTSKRNRSIPPPPPPTTFNSLFGSMPSYNQSYGLMPMMAKSAAPMMMMEMQSDQPYRQKKIMKKLGIRQQRTLKAGFKQVQKTKQYTQTTYAGLKNPSQSSSLVKPSLFWSKLASHLASANPSLSQFLTQSFLYLQSALQFTLAMIFIQNHLNSDYELKTKDSSFLIEANNSFLIFVKEVKKLDYQDKFGVMINQRFFDHQQRFMYEDDGTQIQKTVEQFLVKKAYSLQTVVTNTSGTNLELQILMDIPSGSIPLLSHQYVQILNCDINAYSTVSFQRHFYFPSQGCFHLYPANASRSNLIISRASQLPQIKVLSFPVASKLESLSDIMRSGTHKEVLEYIQKRNIYDNNVFNVASIYYMLEDKQFFVEVVKVLRKRNYFDQNVWSFAVKHQDQHAMLQYIQFKNNYSLKPVDIPILQYFPYYSTRTHKFMDDNKSTIRNVQFKETYRNFLISSIVQKSYSSSEKLAFSYYLMLQDRIDESYQIFSSLNVEQLQQHKLQCDYLSCYLSMYRDYPNFSTASQISKKYISYPILKWQKMFNQIYETLKQYSNEDLDQQVKDNKHNVVQFKTNVVNQQNVLKIMVPKDTKVEVYFYKVNLELYFSDYPFDQVKSLSVVKPKITKVFQAAQSRQQKIKIQDVLHLSDMIVQVYQFKKSLPASRITSFFWSNPKVRVKLNQNQGNLQVFFQGKKQSGCYVKVYSEGSKGTKFYRDGYTDITGTFKYALTDLDGIKRFSILTITKQGGQINQVNPPQKTAYY